MEPQAVPIVQPKDRPKVNTLDEDALFARMMGRSKPLPADSPLWHDPVRSNVPQKSSPMVADQDPGTYGRNYRNGVELVDWGS